MLRLCSFSSSVDSESAVPETDNCASQKQEYPLKGHGHGGLKHNDGCRDDVERKESLAWNRRYEERRTRSEAKSGKRSSLLLHELVR